MLPTQTRVLRLNDVSKQSFLTAVSLHSHTLHSHESLDLLPLHAQRIPVIGSIVRSELRAYEKRNGYSLDFRRAWWTPPLSPAQVRDSERAQIEALGMAAFVSVTDHDSIQAGLDLQAQSARIAPISVEWSLPIAGDCLHIGVHNLPSAEAVALMAEMARYTANPRPAELCNLLALLTSSPDTLLVLNHPCWDVNRAGSAEHNAAVRELLTQGEPWIHSLEVNGLRSWTENRAALQLAENYGLPTVAGGDRHGCRPNAVLNLTRASSFAEFVAEVRGDRHSDVLILPSYDEPLALRQLETVADAVRRYPKHPHGRRGFTSRTFIDLEGYSAHPLSFYWDEGAPIWLRPVLATIVALGSDKSRRLMRPAFRRTERDLIVPSPQTAPPTPLQEQSLQS